MLSFQRNGCTRRLSRLHDPGTEHRGNWRHCYRLIFGLFFLYYEKKEYWNEFWCGMFQVISLASSSYKPPSKNIKMIRVNLSSAVSIANELLTICYINRVFCSLVGWRIIWFECIIGKSKATCRGIRGQHQGQECRCSLVLSLNLYSIGWRLFY